MAMDWNASRPQKLIVFCRHNDICNAAGHPFQGSQPEAIWRGVPDCNLCVLPGCAHAAHLEAPALFNQIVARVLGL